MVGSMFGQQPPLSLSFDASSSYQPGQETYANLSPAPIYSPLEDFGTDFNTDSAPSPGSLHSPVFANSYALTEDSEGDDWKSALGGKTGRSLEPNFLLRTETLVDEQVDFLYPLIPQRVLSPSINPMDLANTAAADDVAIFGCEGINDSQPLFQLPQLPSSSLTVEPSRPTTSKPMAATTSGKPSSVVRASSAIPHTSPALPTPVRTPTIEQQQQEPSSNSYPTRNLKRKSPSASPSASGDDQDEEDHCLSQRSSSPPLPALPRIASTTTATSTYGGVDLLLAASPKKTTHNMIEKRYRTNLNDKLAALRDTVPSLRVMVHRPEGPVSAVSQHQPGQRSEGQDEGILTSGPCPGVGTGGGSREQQQKQGEQNDLGCLTPAHKLNKATILSKATEYIVFLQKCNRNLAKENEALQNKVEGLQMLAVSRRGVTRPRWN